jgi:hypothetical protein
MDGYVENDPMVWRLHTLEDLGRAFSKCENRRSHELHSKSQSLVEEDMWRKM